jgi:hypothetical protein
MMPTAGPCDCGRMGFDPVSHDGTLGPDGKIHTPDRCYYPMPKDPGPAGVKLPRTAPEGVITMPAGVFNRLVERLTARDEDEPDYGPHFANAIDAKNWDQLYGAIETIAQAWRNRFDAELTEQNRKIEELERQVGLLRTLRTLRPDGTRTSDD